jgi:6-phosphogluconate dehydrogenase
MMPGGSPEAYTYIKDIVEKVAAQVCGFYAQTRIFFLS